MKYRFSKVKSLDWSCHAYFPVSEPIDILEYRAFCLTTFVPSVAPDQLSFDRFEKRFNHGVVVTVTFAAH